MLSQFILRKSEYLLCLTESVNEASDIEKKPSATELRQQEWIEANCGNIRLSEHGCNATDCCPHRLNKNPLLNRVYNLWTTCYPQWKQNRVRRLPQCPAACWICVCITLFVHKLVMCFYVSSLWRILRALKDSHVTEKHLLTEVDLLFTDLLSHRLYSWWEWLPRAVILIQNHYYCEDAFTLVFV